MSAVWSIATGLAFFLELALLAAYGYWGWQLNTGWTRWILVIAAPTVMAVIWGLFIAPKAVVSISAPAAFAIELLLVVGAAIALFSAGRPNWGFWLGGVWTINRLLPATTDR